MGNLSTFLAEDTLKGVIEAVGREIRAFLAFVNDPQDRSPYGSLTNKQVLLDSLSSDMRRAAEAFEADPDAFSDENMLKMGEGIDDAIKNFIRIEIRRADGVEGGAQVVAKGIEGDFRNIALENLRQAEELKNKDIAFKFAGQSSIEFNKSGVTKALPFRYLKHHLLDVLKQSGYKAGALIDAASSKTFIAADGDSTLFGGPTLTHMPTLAQSPAKDPLNHFLHAGGVAVVISGNNLERTSQRVIDGIDENVRQNCILVANGAASMAVYNDDGSLSEIDDYRKCALNFKDENNIGDLDVIYIGNDGNPNGNDIAGFEAVGFDRSFLVDKEGADIIDEHLKRHFYPGEEEACAKLLLCLVERLKEKGSGPFFTKELLDSVMTAVR